MRSNDEESSQYQIPVEQEQGVVVESLYQGQEYIENIYQSQTNVPQINRKHSLQAKNQMPNSIELTTIDLQNKGPLGDRTKSPRIEAQRSFQLTPKKNNTSEQRQEPIFQFQDDGSQNQQQIYQSQQPTVPYLIRLSTRSRASDYGLQKQSSRESLSNASPNRQRRITTPSQNLHETAELDSEKEKDEYSDDIQFEDENLLLLFIQTVLFYIPILYFVLVLIYSILLIQKTMQLNLNNFVSAQNIITNVWDNLHSSPIQEIQIISNGEQCSDGFFKSELYNWQGTNDGCYCDGEFSSLSHCETKKMEFFQEKKNKNSKNLDLLKKINHENKNQRGDDGSSVLNDNPSTSCIEIPSTEPHILYSWSKQQTQYCLQFVQNFYFTNSTADCIDGYNQCSDNLCVNSKVCPITTIGSEINLGQRKILQEEKRILGRNLSSERQFEKKNPLLNLQVVLDTDGLCLDPQLNPKQRFPKYYLLKSEFQGCGEFGFMDQNQILTLGQSFLHNFLSDNEIVEFLDTFPGFQRKTETERVYLISQRQIYLNYDNPECLDIVNKNVEKYLLLLFKQEIDINTFINPALQQMLLGFGAISFFLSAVYSFLTLFYLWRDEKELGNFCFFQLSLKKIYLISSLLVMVVIFEKIYYLLFMQQNLLLQFEQESQILNDNCFYDQNIANVIIHYKSILTTVGSQTKYLIDVQYFITFCFALLTLSSALIKVYFFGQNDLNRPIFELNKSSFQTE